MASRHGQIKPSRSQRTRGAQHSPKRQAKETRKRGAPRSKSRELVAVKNGAEAGPPPDLPDTDQGNEGPDPLGDFLDHRSGVHEELGEPIPDELLRNGATGAGLVIAAAALFAILPDPESMRGSGFLLLGENLAADLTQTGQGLAGALFAIGLLLLVADCLLAAFKPRLPVEAHYACAGQLGVGACAAAPAVLAVAILIGSLILWMCFVAIGLWVLSLFAQ